MNLTNTPLISFVIFFRNLPPDTVLRCIDSVLNLSLRKDEREIIVVDDGSADFLLSSFAGREDEIVIVRQPSRGIYAAMNAGMRLATGLYVQFVSASDELLLDGYGHCLDLMRYEKPEIVMFNVSAGKKPHAVYGGEVSETGTEYMRHNTVNPNPCGYAFMRRLSDDTVFDVESGVSSEEFTAILLLKSEKVISARVAACRSDGSPVEFGCRTDKRNLVKRLDDQFDMICRLKEMSNVLPIDERLAVERRVAQLTVDYLVSVVKDARSSRQLKARIGQLERKGLFPLPDKKYNRKYTILSKLLNRKIVRMLAFKLLG